ncbi:MAG: glycosyltransferase family A protein [Candidatus Omnitrophota bacterium]
MSSIAVILISYNMADMIRDCINSLLKQTVSGFRLIIIDDASFDQTECVVKSFVAPNIHYVKNSQHCGIATSRNAGLSELIDEEIIFFIDADCIADPNWIKEGLKLFMEDKDVIAVEGFTTYVSSDYRPCLSEKLYHRDYGPGLCQTKNVAYTREVFKKIGGFDAKNFNSLCEDTDFFYSAKKELPKGKFLICLDMKVVHRKALWTIPSFLKDAHKAKYFIRLLKKHGRISSWSELLFGFILSPKNFMLGLFPPAIFFYIWKNKIRINSFKDALFIVLYVVKAHCFRLLAWYYMIKEKYFVV